MGVQPIAREKPSWLKGVEGMDLSINPKENLCRHSRVMHELLRIGVDKVLTFHRCAMNEYDSIVNRHVKPQLPCTAAAERNMNRAADGVINLLRIRGLQPLTVGGVIDSRPQRMRKRYRNVSHKSPLPGLGKSFIKFEKLQDKDNHVPRLIQYRSSEYTLHMARYTIVVEKALMSEGYEAGNQGFPFIAKGLDALQRGELLHKMWCTAENPVAYLYDHSKFDSMVNDAHWRLESRIMTEVFQSKKLAWLYQQQVNNKFLTQGGLKYTFPYRRCSGDANTSLGNSLINYCILRAVHPNGLILVDGDDSVVFDKSGVSANFEEYGMNTKREVVAEFQKVEFCQSRPVDTPMGWVMCRNPLRAISRMNVRLGRLVKMTDWYWTVGVGEGLTSAYMPIISVMAAKFRKLGKGGKYSMWLLDAGERYRLRTSMFAHHFHMPTEQTRSSFAVAWDLEPEIQRVYEQVIMSAVLHNGA